MAKGVLHLELAPTEALLKLVDAGLAAKAAAEAGTLQGWCVRHQRLEPVMDGASRRPACEVAS